jgi:hypothetical protein
MRHATDFEVRRAPRILTREELTRHLLALILAAVLVWYTFVVPANATATSIASRTPDDEEREGEVRPSVSEFDEGVALNDGDVASLSMLKDSDDSNISVRKGRGDSNVSVDELDWPEYIYPY